MTGPDLSPDRIDALPRWGRVAFAARCALRVLPAARYVPTPRDEAIRKIRLASACCLLPMHAALSAGGKYLALVTKATDIRREEDKRVVGATNQFLAAAAGTAAGEAEDEGGKRQFGHRVTSVHREIGGLYSATEVFDRSALADLNQLEDRTSDPAAAVPVDFFARPLFSGEIPTEWQSVVEEWLSLLSSLSQVRLVDFYEIRRAGMPVTVEEISLLLEEWIHSSPDLRSGVATESAGTAAAAGTAATASPADVVKPPAPAGPAIVMLADRPLEEDDFAQHDFLDFEDYAQSLAIILDEVVETPFTMSINAPWGAGKTSLANMLAARLRQFPKERGRKAHVICRFNAWMHDDAPNLATALVAEVSREADRNRPPWQRLFSPLPATMLEPSSRRWRQAAYALPVIALALPLFWQVSEHLQHVETRRTYVASLNETYQETRTTTPDGTETSRAETASRKREVPQPAVTAPPGIDAADGPLGWFQTRMGLLGTFLTGFIGLVAVLVRLLSSTSLLNFVQSPEKAAEAGTIAAARTTLKRLIEQATAGGNRFVVFVDDIERCKPPRAIDVLDAVNQLLDHHGVIVVLLGDMAAVAAAVQVKYKDLAEIYVPTADLASLGPDRRKEVFGRLYIQKIVQFQFDLPALPRHKIRAYVTSLLGMADASRERDAGPSA